MNFYKAFMKLLWTFIKLLLTFLQVFIKFSLTFPNILSPVSASISRENIIDIPLTSKKHRHAKFCLMCGARRFFPREKQVFLVGFS